MNLYYLRYFVTLAHVRHYTKAAEKLCISQPSLSHAVRQLEKELGIPLFEKSGRNTALTRFGEEFLSCAEHTLSTLDEGIESLHRSARGEGLIRLGFLRTLGIDFIPRLAGAFLKANPDLDIQFTFHSGVTRNLLDGLSARNYDLVFCAQPSSNVNFNSTEVLKQHLVLITPKGHPLSDRSSVDLAETASYPQIFFDRNSGVRSVVDRMFSEIHVTPEIAYETEEDQVIAGLVAAGFGIAVVPYMDILPGLSVDIIQLSSPVSERKLYMISDERIFSPPCVRSFRQFVLEHLPGDRISSP